MQRLVELWQIILNNFIKFNIILFSSFLFFLYLFFIFRKYLINFLSQISLLIFSAFTFRSEIIIGELIYILDLMLPLTGNFFSVYLVFLDQLIKYLYLSDYVVEFVWEYLFRFNYFFVYSLLFFFYILEWGIRIANVLMINFILLVDLVFMDIRVKRLDSFEFHIKIHFI